MSAIEHGAGVTATPVAPLVASVSEACPSCMAAVTWQVGPNARSCSRHVGDVLAALYAEFARRHARMFGTRPIRRHVGPWVYADTGEQVFP